MLANEEAVGAVVGRYGVATLGDLLTVSRREVTGGKGLARDGWEASGWGQSQPSTVSCEDTIARGAELVRDAGTTYLINLHPSPSPSPTSTTATTTTATPTSHQPTTPPPKSTHQSSHPPTHPTTHPTHTHSRIPINLCPPVLSHSPTHPPSHTRVCAVSHSLRCILMTVARDGGGVQLPRLLALIAAQAEGPFQNGVGLIPLDLGWWIWGGGSGMVDLGWWIWCI